MNNKRIAFFLFAVVLILACNFPTLNGTGGNAPATAPPSQQSVTEPPPLAFTATNTVTVSTAPMALPNGAAVNCRSGPGTGWSVVIVLNPGQAAEIVGKSPDGLWWNVKNPFMPGNQCWVSTSFTTTTGNLGGIPVAAIPPTPIVTATNVNVPATSGAVTSVSMSLSKTEIHVAGCMGPIQPLTIYATIEANGPLKTNWHFETQQKGALPSHGIKFAQAGQKDVSDSFTPPVVAGTYTIQLIMDGVSLKGMNAVITYKITC